ncbi:MAG: asparagine synthetase B, partial [Pirellulaceae bacterium]
MCGISGWATQNDPRQAIPIVRRMTDALVHRGPDEGGVVATGMGAVGMRRLSIIDIVGGTQPMASADGRHALVYNGELYEHRQLRQRLAARGAKFRTRSDTEVLLAALALEGEACIPQLNGMFAFALADRRDQTLLIARDPLGIKPLYYYVPP